jgi:hypothetical protein
MTAKQIPKQDLKITSKIKPKEKNKKQGKQTKTNRTRTKQDKTYTKKGIGHGVSGGQESMCGWDLEESRAGVLEHTRINGIWDAYRAKGIIKHGNRTFRFCWVFVWIRFDLRQSLGSC